MSQFQDWRGTVGVVKPTYRTGSLEEFIRMLPEGIGIVPLFIGLRDGSAETFQIALAEMEDRITELANIGVDLIHAEGAPILMTHGYEFEGQLLQKWSDSYQIPATSSGSTQVAAMQALGMHSVVGITYLPGKINDLFDRYLTDAGFEVREMTGLEVTFERISYLSPREVYAAAKAAVARHPDVDGIYLLGSGWRVLEVIQLLEDDLDIPVLHAQAARVWYIQQHFRVRQRHRGLGRLLAELPPLISG